MGTSREIHDAFRRLNEQRERNAHHMVAQNVDEITIEVINLSEVVDDPDWATDDEKIEGLRTVLRAKKQFPTPVLRRVWDKDGSFRYTIIDGFHRIRALVAEGVTAYPMMVRECTEHEEEMDRIAASLDKPDPILHNRAIQVLRQAFARDMLQLVAKQTLMTRTLDAHGWYRVVPRQGEIPTDPIQSLLVLNNHLIAESYVATEEKPNVRKKRLPAWVQRYTTWQESIASQFGFNRSWLVKILGFDLLGLPADMAKQHAVPDYVFRIMEIGDEEIQMLLIGRVKSEHPNAQAIDVALGYCLPTKPELKYRRWINRKTRQEVLRLLAGHTIAQIVVIEQRDRSAYEQDEFNRRSREALREDQAIHAKIQADQSLRANAVFAVVARPPGPASRVSTQSANKIEPAPSPTPQSATANYAPCLDAATLLFDEWATYERGGGTWQAIDVQQHLQRILAFIQSRVKE